jgi:ribosomal protein S24E
MSKIWKGANWHTWVGILLSLPILIVSITAIMLGLESLYKNKESEPVFNVSWLPGYSSSLLSKEYQAKINEVKASYSAPDGYQYIGTKAGLIVIDTNLNSFKVEELEGVDIFTIQALNNNIYIGAKTGLYVFQKNQIKKLCSIDTRSIDFRFNGTIAISNNKDLYISDKNQKHWHIDTIVKQSLTRMASTKTFNAELLNIPLHKLVLDLHTGKAFFGKNFENIWIIMIGSSMTLLSITGFWMWYSRRRKKIKNSKVKSKPLKVPKIKLASASVASLMLMLLIIFLSCDHKQKQKLATKDIPPKLSNTINEKLNNQQPDSINWYFDKDKSEYEAKIYSDSMESKYTLIQNGEIIKSDIQIAWNQIPTNIQALISKYNDLNGHNFYKAKIKTKEGIERYEIEYRQNDKKIKLRFSAEAKLIEKKVEDVEN